MSIVPALLLLLTACDHGSEEPILLRAMVAFPPKDTIRFELPATTHRCSDGRSLLLEAVSPEGSGVLMRLRYRDSLVSDSYPIVLPADTATVPAAIVAVRYILHEAPHVFVLDSGAVLARPEGSKITARVAGVGREMGIQIPARIEYRDVPLSVDTLPCEYVP